MNSVTQKSVLIEGDKAMFASKGAVDRFKRDLRLNDETKLKSNDYFREGWTYKMLSSSDSEIKVKLVNMKDLAGENRVLESDERRKMLREKLRLMRQQKISPNKLKTSLKGKVPEELLDAYLMSRRAFPKYIIPSPDEMLNKPEENKPLVHTMVQSFGAIRTTNNPLIHYYKLLAKHLGLPMDYVPPQTEQQKSTNEFVNMLRNQRQETVNTEVDAEMSEIYKSLGIDAPEPNKTEVDDEMKEIYKSLGVQVDEESKSMDM